MAKVFELEFGVPASSVHAFGEDVHTTVIRTSSYDTVDGLITDIFEKWLILPERRYNRYYPVRDIRWIKCIDVREVD
jgi:hypothetical protein